MRAIKGNIILKINSKQKEKYALTKDVTIHIEKNYNFNLREDRASMGYIVDGNGLTAGDFCLCHHLTLEQNYHIENETILTEEEKKLGFKVASIPVDMVFATSPDGLNWTPCKDFLITMRIFQKYSGIMEGIEPQLVKNRMYIISGFDEYDGEKNDLSGNVAITTDNCDYQIIWHDVNNREQSLIRTRHREIQAIDGIITEGVKNGEYMIGLAPNNCKTLN